MVVKDSIMQLCRFFKAISSTIDVVVEHTVNDFIETISSGASDVQMSNFTLSVLQKSVSPKDESATLAASPTDRWLCR